MGVSNNKLIVVVVVGRDDNVDSFPATNGLVFKFDSLLILIVGFVASSLRLGLDKPL